MSGVTEGSQGGRLLDAVEADPCGRRGDGHGPGHGHSEGVMVLPAVPPLPHGRAHLWGRQRLSCACRVGGQSWELGVFSPAPCPCRALKGRLGCPPSRHPHTQGGTGWFQKQVLPLKLLASEAPASVLIPVLDKLPTDAALGHAAFPAPSPCHLLFMV